MPRIPRPPSYVLFLLLYSGILPLLAETGKLLVVVEDPKRQPVRGVEIGIEGAGGSGLTGDDGKALLPLAKDTSENDSVTLQILHSPPGKDPEIISPWDFSTRVPSFRNKAENFVLVIVVQRGDRAALENNSVLTLLAARITRANIPNPTNAEGRSEDPKANLAAVAKQYGFSPDDLDVAIRALGARTNDPYEAGIAALYERNYAKASEDLQDSLQHREERVAADEKLVSADKKQAADAALFLGLSLAEQRKYRASAAAYQKCLHFRPDDVMALNNAAVSYYRGGDYASAEPLYIRALSLFEKSPGSELQVAVELDNLGAMLTAKGDFPGAEKRYARALEIENATLGSENPTFAGTLANLGLLHQDERNYDGAKKLLRRALAIMEKANKTADGPDIRPMLTKFGGLLWAKGDYSEAEAVLRRALAISKKTFGPDDPAVAYDRNNLACVLQAKGDYPGAQNEFLATLEIREAALGSDSADVAITLNNLGSLMSAEGELAEAGVFYRAALAFYDEPPGPRPAPVVAAAFLNDLGVLLQAKGFYAGAEPLLLQALAIREKALGPRHAAVAESLNNLGFLLQSKGDDIAAGPLYMKALEIDQRALPPDGPATRIIREHLVSLHSDRHGKQGN